MEKKDLESLEKVSVYLEKTRLADFMDLMQRPGRLLWLNLVAGMARGVGMVIGASVLSVLLFLIIAKLLRYGFQHVGGLPWVGFQLEQAVQWILEIVDKHKESQ